jgi:hypothetical protein
VLHPVSAVLRFIPNEAHSPAPTFR